MIKSLFVAASLTGLLLASDGAALSRGVYVASQMSDPSLDLLFLQVIGADRPSALEISEVDTMGPIADRADSQTAGNGHVVQEGTHPVLVWDLPTRVFHWTLVVSFFSAMATGDPDRFRDLHVYFGYVVLGLI